jgi:hypothetical protein
VYEKKTKAEWKAIVYKSASDQFKIHKPLNCNAKGKSLLRKLSLH